MERVERNGNEGLRKIIRFVVIGAIIGAVLYGCSRIPYFVVKRNLSLQYGFTYENNENVVEQRKKYVSERYYSMLYEDASVRVRQNIRDHKGKCELFYVQLGKRDAEGEIPYTVLYELSYEDGALPTERVHIEGKQKVERFLGIWWKVDEDRVTHSCFFNGDVEPIIEELRREEHNHSEHAHKHE
ncbi:MAG: hypothetical protein IJZ55_13970 [Lachnospiraceae bacterium]|nr:hypothetical protein [Lachnospiraceae bacterium]